jgi:hypothetical protein
MIQPYTYNRLTPYHPTHGDGVSWRFSRFLRRRAQRPITDRPAHRPPWCMRAKRARSFQIRVKSAQNCAPLAPNTSASAHNSTEFVPPTASKDPEKHGTSTNASETNSGNKLPFPRFSRAPKCPKECLRPQKIKNRVYRASRSIIAFATGPLESPSRRPPA